MAVLNGDLPDRVPVVPQTFMMAAETAGYLIGDIANNGKKMAESSIISQRKFGYDGIVLDIDDASLAEACGAKVIFANPKEPALVDEHKPLVTDLRDVPNLKIPDPYSDGRLPAWLEATRTVVEEVGDEVFVLGRSDQGPFDLLSLIRGTENLMMELLTVDPEVIRDALDWCRRANLEFAKAQKDAGAHATSIGDSYAGPNLIHPDMYRQFALEHEITLAKQVQDYGIPWSLHICGATDPIIEDMLSTGARIIEVDWQVDMARAHEICGDRAVLMGNIDPSDPLAHGTPEQVDAKSRKVIEDCKGRSLFLSSGCAMGRLTPPENMQAMVDAPKKYGTYEQILEMGDE